MRNYDHILFQIWMRVLLGLLFLISILFKIGMGLDSLTTHMVAGNGIDWMTAAYEVRLVLTLEIIIFLLFVFIQFGRGFKWMYFLICGGLIYQYIFLHHSAVIGNYGILNFCSISFSQGAGFEFIPSYFASIVAAISFGIIGYFAVQIKENYKPLKWYISLGVSIAFIIGIQSIELPQAKDFNAVTNKLNISTGAWNPFLNRLYAQFPESQNGNALLCSFSVTCGHCNDFAKRIGAELKGQGDRIVQDKTIVFIFYTDLTDLNAFQLEVDTFMIRNVNESKSAIKTMVLNRSEILNLTGNQFPVFTLLKDGNITKMLISDQFNYFERDSFFRES